MVVKSYWQMMCVVLLGLWCVTAKAADPPPTLKPHTTRGDKMIAKYFAAEARHLASTCLNELGTLDDWKARQSTDRKRLLEMLGLDPMPERTDLRATLTAKVDHTQFTVEKLHYQSRPGLYVTANLYVPKNITGPVPAILYVCGHSGQVKDGISYGNKSGYQHHGAWFARHGYVCMIIDTLQLGEIQGVHHGTYRHDRWWWNARGYVPTGVEVWNSMRAIDYLQSRKEVDADRIGMTGRSGGGSYTWWTAAVDERVKVAVPVAGITDLINHVTKGSPGRLADGVVEGHCDCMYSLNTYRWDFPHVAAMIAPRPLLIQNSDKDGIFPLDGVVRLHKKVRAVYHLYGADANLGLHLTEGRHKDTQRLRVGAFEWFERHLKGKKSATFTVVAEKLFDRTQLRVFGKTLPKDELNTKIDETFTKRVGAMSVPKDDAAWARQRAKWQATLRSKSFNGWPVRPGKLLLKPAFDVTQGGLRFAAWDFDPQPHIRLRLYLAHRAGLDKPDLVVLNVLDNDSWAQFVATMRVGFEASFKGETLPAADLKSFVQEKRMLAGTKWAMAYVAPRGVGPTAWNASKKKQTQHRRRFMLLGQTLDGMRVWDSRRAIHALRAVMGAEIPLWLQAEGQMAGNVLYASLFEKSITRLDLYHLPRSHREGPVYLNVLRFMDLPAALAMAADRSEVRVYVKDPDNSFGYTQSVVGALQWDKKRLQIRKLP